MKAIHAPIIEEMNCGGMHPHEEDGPCPSRLLSHLCDRQARPRDGRVLEELGTYDPSVPDTDARALFNEERVAHWLSVGAQPSEKVAILIKKYGPNGTHLEQQEKAIAKLKGPKVVPDAGPAAPSLKKLAEEAAAKAAAEAAAAKAAEEAAAAKAAAEAAAAEASCRRRGARC